MRMAALVGRSAATTAAIRVRNMLRSMPVAMRAAGEKRDDDQGSNEGDGGPWVQAVEDSSAAPCYGAMYGGPGKAVIYDANAVGLNSELMDVVRRMEASYCPEQCGFRSRPEAEAWVKSAEVRLGGN